MFYSGPTHSPLRLGYGPGPQIFGGPNYYYLLFEGHSNNCYIGWKRKYFKLFNVLQWRGCVSVSVGTTVHVPLGRIHFIIFVLFIFWGPKFKFLYISQKIKTGPTNLLRRSWFYFMWDHTLYFYNEKWYLYNYFLTTFSLILTFSSYSLSSFFSPYYFWPIKEEKTKVVIKVVHISLPFFNSHHTRSKSYYLVFNLPIFFQFSHQCSNHNHTYIHKKWKTIHNIQKKKQQPSHEDDNHTKSYKANRSSWLKI